MTPKTNASVEQSKVSTLQDDLIDEAYMFGNQFFPGAQFRVVSEQITWAPVPEGVGEGQFLTSFNTRLIQYTGARNVFAFFFPYTDAEVQQGVTYQLSTDFEDAAEDEFDEDADALEAENLINVEFQPA